MDIKPAPYKLTLVHGQSYSNTFTINLNGTGWNLTGYTAAFTVRAAASASSPILLQLTQASGITLGNGSFTITITAAQLAAIEAGTYQYDLWFYTGTNAYPIFAARFELDASVTHV
jgi:hypothetical protein